MTEENNNILNQNIKELQEKLEENNIKNSQEKHELVIFNKLFNFIR